MLAVTGLGRLLAVTARLAVAGLGWLLGWLPAETALLAVVLRHTTMSVVLRRTTMSVVLRRLTVAGGWELVRHGISFTLLIHIKRCGDPTSPALPRG